MCGLQELGANLVPCINYVFHSDLKRKFATIYFIS
jgi:hypothetical protein